MEILAIFRRFFTVLIFKSTSDILKAILIDMDESEFWNKHQYQHLLKAFGEILYILFLLAQRG